MNLGVRLRRLESHIGPDRLTTPLAEWASTLPLEDIRALRDYLRDIVADGTTGSTSAQRHERAVTLLAVAPEASDRASDSPSCEFAREAIAADRAGVSPRT